MNQVLAYQPSIPAPFTEGGTRMLSTCVLSLALVWLAACVVRAALKNTYTLAQFPIYMYGRFMTKVRWGARLTGDVPIDAPQGAIIVSNHRGPVDPAFIALASKRQVHWMVAREYLKVPIIGPALRVLQVIPVGRGGIDTAATKAAIRYARQGDLVGMFPEGRINDTDRLMLPGRPGAALVALRARVPVIPCYLEGTPYGGQVFSFFWLAAKARLVVGKPIDISAYYGRESERDVLEELTRRFMIEIAKLGGVENYVPELAGRRWRTADDEQADDSINVNMG